SRSSSGYFLGAAMTLILPRNESLHQTRHETIGGSYVAMAGLCDIVAAEVWLRTLQCGPTLPQSTQHVLLTEGDR
ncbi:hypothetical protein FHS13_004264, partial [Nocardiopsis algeriensis]|nr:hypothetical protein [Nocardiopsis algeriensis]